MIVNRGRIKNDRGRKKVMWKKEIERKYEKDQE